ncbi:hypothetical protein [Paenibacillus sp. IITD108]|uniref:hypothetical protein n=1 Tax=Paenibacillus sp. IITD108 TaxID=3116649 RepID=UPI002F4148FE
MIIFKKLIINFNENRDLYKSNSDYFIFRRISLYGSLEAFFLKSRSQQNDIKLVNYALRAQACADSEVNNWKASHAINGSWNSWQTDLWHSNAFEKEH